MKSNVKDFRIDVVLVSDAKNIYLKEITNLAVKSLAGSSHINIIVVESNKLITYENAITLHPDGEFNYNHYLNIGARYGQEEYIFFGNNDLIFAKDWDKHIIKEMNKHKVVSASPLCPLIGNYLQLEESRGSLYGYELVSRFCGWAFIWSREFYLRVNGLDEDFKFWCSDNVVVEQLVHNKQKHILVTSSIVLHLGRTTLKTLVDKQVIQKYTIQEIDKFNKRFNKNLWDSPHIKGFRA